MAEHILPDFPERWKSIDFAPYYEVSTYGRVRYYSRNGCNNSSSGPQLMKLDYSSGYPRVKLRFNGMRRAFGVHRLVAEAFIPNPENKPTVNHKDGNKHNNLVTNFEWATYPEQTAHALKLGLIESIGIRRRKLSDEQIAEIKMRRRVDGTSTPKLAAMFGVAQGTVWKILAGWTQYAMAVD